MTVAYPDILPGSLQLLDDLHKRIEREIRADRGDNAQQAIDYVRKSFALSRMIITATPHETLSIQPLLKQIVEYEGVMTTREWYELTYYLPYIKPYEVELDLYTSITRSVMSGELSTQQIFSNGKYGKRLNHGIRNEAIVYAVNHFDFLPIGFMKMLARAFKHRAYIDDEAIFKNLDAKYLLQIIRGYKPANQVVALEQLMHLVGPIINTADVIDIVDQSDVLKRHVLNLASHNKSKPVIFNPHYIFDDVIGALTGADMELARASINFTGLHASLENHPHERDMFINTLRDVAFSRECFEAGRKRINGIVPRTLHVLKADFMTPLVFIDQNGKSIVVNMRDFDRATRQFNDRSNQVRESIYTYTDYDFNIHNSSTYKMTALWQLIDDETKVINDYATFTKWMRARANQPLQIGLITFDETENKKLQIMRHLATDLVQRTIDNGEFSALDQAVRDRFADAAFMLNANMKLV